MKIRTKRDVEELKETIKNELGIDIVQYRDAEVASDVVDLIIFPKYVVKGIIRPIVIALVLYVLGFFALDLIHIEYLIYLIIAFLLFSISGLFAGIILLVRKMRNDVGGIVDYSLSIMETSIDDIDEIDNRITSDNKKDVLGLLFQGIIHIVTIPMLSEALEQKVAFVGKITKGFMKKSLMMISDRIDFDEDNINENIVDDGENIEGFNTYKKTIANTRKTSSKITNGISRIVSIPFKLVFCISIALLIIFIYLIH
jgi:hypothetical protein